MPGPHESLRSNAILYLYQVYFFEKLSWERNMRPGM